MLEVDGEDDGAEKRRSREEDKDPPTEIGLADQIPPVFCLLPVRKTHERLISEQQIERNRDRERERERAWGIILLILLSKQETLPSF